MSNVDEGRRSVVGVLGAALATAVISALIVGAGLGAAIAIDNGFGLGDALMLTLHLSGLYGSVFVTGLLAAAVGLLVLGQRPGPRIFTALVLAFCVFLNGILRFAPAVQLFAVVPSMSLLGLLDLAVVLVASGVVGAAVITTNPARRLGRIAVAVVLIGALHGFHLWHETPKHSDLASIIPGLVENAPESPGPARTGRFENAKLVVLGFDGLSWEVLIPLLQRGELPNFARLLKDAAYGYSETLPYAISPVIWETISTGQAPERHGIGHHFHFEFEGVSETVVRLPVFPLCNSPMGVRRLLAATKSFAPWETVSASSTHARAARIWEIASREGISVGVYSWLNTTPATPVRGFLRGHGVYRPTKFPENIGIDFTDVVPVEPHNATGKAPTIDRITERRRIPWNDFIDLATEFQPEFLMYYTHDGDGVNHVNWKYEVVGPGMFFGGFRHPEFRPGVAVTTINGFLDELLGDVMARIPDDATIAIVSDHGFEFRGYEHDNAPPGVFILRGPGIEPGSFLGASVYDVSPTLLHVLGLPAAEDMDGAPVAPVLQGRDVKRVATYGPAATPLDAEDVDPEKLNELESYLRDLGYVVD